MRQAGKTKERLSTWTGSHGYKDVVFPSFRVQLQCRAVRVPSFSTCFFVLGRGWCNSTRGKEVGVLGICYLVLATDCSVGSTEQRDDPIARWMVFVGSASALDKYEMWELERIQKSMLDRRSAAMQLASSSAT